LKLLLPESIKVGIVVRQSISNSVWAYLGMALGYVNVILLFPNLMDAGQFGLTRILLAVSMIAGQFSQLSVVNITIKFFPYFRNEEKKHNGFLFGALLLTGIGTLLTCLGLLVLKAPIVHAYIEKSELFVENYNYLFLFLIFTVFYNVFDSYCRSLFKTTFQQFTKEVLLRVLIAGLLVAYYFDWIDFDGFLFWYVLAYGSSTVLVLLYTIKLGQFFLKPNFSMLTKKFLKEIGSYGVFTILSTVSIMLVNRIDVVLIGYFIGLDDIAIYSVSFYVATVVAIPARAIHLIVSPIIAESWKQNNLEKISELYSKTAINQLVMGLLLFLGIWVNVENLFHMLPSEYANGKYVILFIGLARLINMAAGINGLIILTSKWYRYDMFFNLFLVVVVIVTDVIFIPLYGIDGAALASLVTIVVFNIIKFSFLKIKCGMQPFTTKSLLAILIAALTFFVVSKIPVSQNFIVDILARSTVATVLFVPLVYFLKISEDINSVIEKFLRINK